MISIDIVSPTILEPPYQVNKAGENIDKILKYEKLTEDNIPCYDYEVRKQKKETETFSNFLIYLMIKIKTNQNFIIIIRK